MAADGEYQEVQEVRQGQVASAYFEKLGGGSFIYRIGADRWCIGPVKYGISTVWAEKSCPATQLPLSKNDPWEGAGQPKVSVSRPCVRILNGRGLVPKDLDGLSDPYIVCTIQRKPQLTFKTRTILKHLDPIWNEVHVIDGVELGDHLFFKVMDWDADDSDDLMGEAKVLVQPGGFKGQLGLTRAGRKAGALEVEVDVPHTSAIKHSEEPSENDPKSVVQALSNMGSPDLQMRALSIFRHIVTTDDMRSQFVAAGAVQVLVSGLSSASVSETGELASALGNLGKCLVGRRIIIASGGVQQLLKLLLNGTLSNKVGAMQALTRLVTVEKVRHDLVDAGAVSELLKILHDEEVGSTSKRPEAATCAARLLALLSSTPEAAAAIQKNNTATCILLLIPGMRSQRDKAQLVCALREIVHTDEQRDALLEAGAVPLLINLLQKGSVEAKWNAAACVTALASAIDHKRFLTHAGAMLDAGVMHPLLALIAEPDIQCMEQAARALSKLAGSRKTGSVMIYAGMLDELIELLKSRGHAKCRVAATTVLQALAKHNRSLMESSILSVSDHDLVFGAVDSLVSERSVTDTNALPRPAGHLPALSPRSHKTEGKQVSKMPRGRFQREGNRDRLQHLPSILRHQTTASDWNMGLQVSVFNRVRL
eukprot:TRINITY_DN7477_c0_g5_i1.p1 TRINITY_DN7477_c0_g5~~TRINITY_DN7477_c0_g5_i1.p1  ORF type:complete len:714 (-),score=118.03 TRINITY_DN7477_c0_g5_i1:168-2123(-)